MTILDLFEIKDQGVILNGRGFSSDALDEMLNQSGESAMNLANSKKFKGLSKLKKSPSVITDSFKFQQAEHKIEGHDQGKRFSRTYTEFQIDVCQIELLNYFQI